MTEVNTSPIDIQLTHKTAFLILPPQKSKFLSKKLEDAFTNAMKESAFIKGMNEYLRLPIVYRKSKDLNAYVAHNYESYGRMLKDVGLIK